MSNRNVALFHSKNLLGESLEQMLRNTANVEILGPWMISAQAYKMLADQLVDLVIVVDEEKDNHQASILISQILEQYSGLPIIQVMLEKDKMRIYNSQTVSANSRDLITAIQTLSKPLNHNEWRSNEESAKHS